MKYVMIAFSLLIISSYGHAGSCIIVVENTVSTQETDSESACFDKAVQKARLCISKGVCKTEANYEYDGGHGQPVDGTIHFQRNDHSYSNG